MGGPQLPRVKPGALRLRAPRGSQRLVRMDRIIMLEPVPQPRRGRLKIGITAEMKTEQDDRLERRGVLSQPTQRYLEGLQPPEIVGQVENPTLGAIRRLWWRAFDRLCYCIVLKRLGLCAAFARFPAFSRAGFRPHRCWVTASTNAGLWVMRSVQERGSLDSPVEGGGFEPVWGFSCQVVFWFVGGSLFGARKSFFVPSPAIRFAERAEGGTETVA